MTEAPSLTTPDHPAPADLARDLSLRMRVALKCARRFTHFRAVGGWRAKAAAGRILPQTAEGLRERGLVEYRPAQFGAFLSLTPTGERVLAILEERAQA